MYLFQTLSWEEEVEIATCASAWVRESRASERSDAAESL